MEPLFFQPDFKERVWGGQKLKTAFGKEIPFKHTGESWEVACHPNGSSIIREGKYKGKTLLDVFKENKELFGEKYINVDKFPLLIKLIDAKDDLSVQVHPDDSYANKFENGELGKNEAWYILEAEENAKLIAGLKDGVTKSDFKKALEKEELENVLNCIPVKKGDVINIPAGFIHAIGGGILLAEVQQNSDTTYRVYDWGRVGLDGKKRELHIEKSLDVIDFKGIYSKDLVNGITINNNGFQRVIYISNKYFALEKIVISDEYLVNNKKDNFEIYICLEGNLKLIINNKEYLVKKGDSFLMPANINTFSIKGTGKILRTYVPINTENIRLELIKHGFNEDIINANARLEK